MKYATWLSVLLPLCAMAQMSGRGAHRRFAVDPITFPAPASADNVAQLTADEVRTLATSAAMAADNPAIAVAVVDRAGRILAIYRRPQASDADVEKALSLARTGAFFSNRNTPLSSRTVRAISRENFPEGIPNQPAGALFGIENTNRGCSFNTVFHPGKDVPRSMNATGTGFGAGIATVPGGLPLFRGGTEVVGGIGVAGFADNDAAEYAAFSATAAFGNRFGVHLPLPDPGGVFLDGFLLPFVALQFPAVQAATTLDGAFQAGPAAGMEAPDGWLAGPFSGRMLSADDVNGIIQNAIARANVTRAAIRLPITHTHMVMSVADLDGKVLGLYRMPDATIFSIDVAVAKARNVVYFSGSTPDLPGVPAGTAVTNRTIGFGSQPYFPSGINGTPPGPFRDLYNYDSAHPCTQGSQPPPANQNGVVFFPGSAPLYRSGVMVGGLGVSGDGVEQDDYVTSGGALGYEAPASKRADQIFIRNVRLPYWKFPRDPELQ